MQSVDLPLEPVAAQQTVQEPSAPQVMEPAPERQDDVSANVELKPGDVLIIPQSWF